MSGEKLAYSYKTVCSVLDARGYSAEYIQAFLVKHQNRGGYISVDLLPEEETDG